MSFFFLKTKIQRNRETESDKDTDRQTDTKKREREKKVDIHTYIHTYIHTHRETERDRDRNKDRDRGIVTHNASNIPPAPLQTNKSIIHPTINTITTYFRITTTNFKNKNTSSSSNLLLLNIKFQIPNSSIAPSKTSLLVQKIK